LSEENVSPISSEGLGELLVKRYAQAAGVDEDTARRVLESMKVRKPSRFEKIKAMLELLGEYWDKVDPTMLPVLKPLILQELGMGGGDGIGERIARAIEEVSAAKLAVEAAGKILGGREEKPKIPEEVLKSLEGLSKAVEELKRKVEGEEENQTLQLLGNLQQQIQALQQELQNLKQGGASKDVIEEVVEKIEERKQKAVARLRRQGGRALAREDQGAG